MKVSFDWHVRRRLCAEAEQDLGRRFAAGTPAYVLLLAAFAYGSSCWPSHQVPIAVFAGLFAGAAYWHQTIVTAMRERYDDCPAFWSATLRRAVYASAALWAAFTAWAGVNHADANQIFVLTLVTAGVAVGMNASIGADEPLTERCLLIVLTPVMCIQLANGAFALIAASGLLLALLIAQSRVQSVTYWERIAERAELENRVEKAERTLAIVVEAAAPLDRQAAGAPVKATAPALVPATDLVSVLR
jgi:hypothetical protein